MRLHIYHPVAVRAISLLTSWLLKAWLGSLDVWVEFDRDDALPSRRKTPGLFLFWHETLLLPTHTHAGEGFGMLIGTHRDGEIIAQVMEFMGGTAFRGSSTRDGARALREMMEANPDLHLAITPDGPKGPRRVLQMGSIFLASRAGIPIIPVGFATRRPWRIRSWDRFMLPKPFSAGRCVFATPIDIPARLGREGLEEYRLKVEQAVEAAQARAEDLAEREVTGPPRLPLRAAQKSRD